MEETRPFCCRCKEDFPVAEDYYSKALSIPIFPTLTRQEQDFVIEKISEVCK